ncbi:MlaD family protein [Nocardia africana]|uniref:MlaD family protein n=1 Tax=Nocardia africana TaxID=134964 RepID=UPI001D147398|nr:MlaD family protein [Nocardia africana]MCC3312270.1 MlaD family protein [Nocardia africana]
MATTVAVGTSCAIDPDRVPLPGTGTSSGYGLTFEFTSAMNLPDRANVMMDGLRVGQVQNTALSGSAVKVEARISDATRVPADATASIRQDTLLGDTYVAIEHDTDRPATGFLPAGAMIPATRTTSPPQLEDVMAVLANFINGGSIQRAQDALVKINKVMPAPPDVAHIADTVSVDLQDLSARNSEIDRFLEQLNATSTAVDQSGPQLAQMFDDSATHYWHRLNADVMQYVGTLLPSIGSIFQGGIWLVPLLESLASGATVIRSTAEDVPSDAAAISTFLTGTLLPFLRNPSLNIQSIGTQDGTDLTAGLGNVLRILGAVR